MLRAWLRVARPDDWTGSLARIGTAFGFLLLLLIPTLARLPEGWQRLAFNQEWLVRGLLVLVTLWVGIQLRALAYAALPGAVVLLRSRVRLPGRLRGRWVKVAQIREIHVDRRVEGEVFVLEMTSGTELDMCPVAWDGATRLYARLAPRVLRARKRALTRANKELAAPRLSPE